LSCREVLVVGLRIGIALSGEKWEIGPSVADRSETWVSIAVRPRGGGVVVLRRFFGAKERSADKQDAGEQETPQSGEAEAVVVTQVATTTEEGATVMEWAVLGKVPMPQCVPAAPGQFVEVPTALSEVSAATVARLTGGAQATSGSSESAPPSAS
jgi:hypothetical protein